MRKIIKNLIILLMVVGSLYLSSQAETVPDYVVKAVMKVEGKGLTTKWNKGHPHHHSFGAMQMSCIAMKELGYIRACKPNNSYYPRDYNKAERWLSGHKGVVLGAKYLAHIKKRYGYKTWQEAVRAYNQGYGGRNNRRAYHYLRKTGL
jgi:hypothetical protein